MYTTAPDISELELFLASTCKRFSGSPSWPAAPGDFSVIFRFCVVKGRRARTKRKVAGQSFSDLRGRSPSLSRSVSLSLSLSLSRSRFFPLSLPLCASRFFLRLVFFFSLSLSLSLSCLRIVPLSLSLSCLRIVPLSLSLCRPVCPSFYLCAYVLAVCLSVCLSVCRPVCLPVGHLSTCLSIYLLACVPVSLSLSVRVSVCLSLCLSESLLLAFCLHFAGLSLRRSPLEPYLLRSIATLTLHAGYRCNVQTSGPSPAATRATGLHCTCTFCLQGHKQ